MPTIRTYVVTQEREIKVDAISPADAIALADRAFREEAINSNEGAIRSSIKTTAMQARVDY